MRKDIHPKTGASFEAGTLPLEELPAASLPGRERGALRERAIHFRRPKERGFLRGEYGRTTVLFGGLSSIHDALIEASMEGLGFRVERIPTPTKANYRTGREYGNNGLCNPAHFTVGALVDRLKRLRDDEGLPTEEILRNYAFASGGSCGPCRYGMYEAEFRLALRNSGFDGFRVLPFQQMGGLGQLTTGTGLKFDLGFALALLEAVLLGDVLNALSFQLRPYEAEGGQTDRVIGGVVRRMAEYLREKKGLEGRPGWMGRLMSRVTAPLGESPEERARLAQRLLRDRCAPILRACAEAMDAEMEVDFLRPKPVCKVTGEFWAQVTEGDGNFHMLRFLESQGAEVLVEPIATWIQYLLAQRRERLEERKGLDTGEGFVEGVKAEAAFRRETARLGLTRWALDREYNRMRKALGGTTQAQVSQRELRRLGGPYYNHRCGGGEGHLEVAKTIYYTTKGLAHMVMSLKPFGCMPSTQSDGVQTAVVSRYPGMIFVPIETSGEGDVNAYSRAQMALGEAKARCKEEFAACVEKTGYGLEEIRRYCLERPPLRRPLQRVPQHEGVVGKGANFVLAVGKRMDRDRAFRRRRKK